jgi:hypothetical protein
MTKVNNKEDETMRTTNNYKQKESYMNDKSIYTQTDSGYLQLKDGQSGMVIFELEFLENGEVGNGYIRGNKPLIELAAKDKVATLLVSPGISVAIAVDGCRDDTAAVTGLLTRWQDFAPTPFEATVISSLERIGDGNQIVMEFVGANGKQQVIVPATAIRGSIPVLQQIVDDGTGPTPTLPWQMLEAWRTGYLAGQPLVIVSFNGDLPHAFDPDTARRLAEALVERAVEVESQTPLTQH